MNTWFNKNVLRTTIIIPIGSMRLVYLPIPIATKITLKNVKSNMAYIHEMPKTKYKKCRVNMKIPSYPSYLVIIFATSHDLAPQKVALWKGNPSISGKPRLVKYYSIWPDPIGLAIFFSSKQQMTGNARRLAFQLSASSFQ